MLCRVGISIDPATRRTYWERQVVGLSNLRILKQTRSRAQAQEYENQYAARAGCQSHAGGPNTPGTWSVYRFDYLRMRG